VVNSHVFGSNTSCSSWEPFRQAIEALIRVYIKQSHLVKKHTKLLSLLKWDELLKDFPDITPAVPCTLNQGVLDPNGNMIAPQGSIYINDILSAEVLQYYMS
jgi:hypothetical protein